VDEAGFIRITLMLNVMFSKKQNKKQKTKQLKTKSKKQKAKWTRLDLAKE